MLFADADPIIAISMTSAAALGAGVGGGIAGAAKMFISFIERQNTQFVTEIQAARAENRALTKTAIDVSRETTVAVNSLKIAFEGGDR